MDSFYLKYIPNDCINIIFDKLHKYQDIIKFSKLYNNDDYCSNYYKNQELSKKLVYNKFGKYKEIFEHINLIKENKIFNAINIYDDIDNIWLELYSILSEYETSNAFDKLKVNVIINGIKLEILLKNKYNDLYIQLKNNEYIQNKYITGIKNNKEFNILNFKLYIFTTWGLLYRIIEMIMIKFDHEDYDIASIPSNVMLLYIDILVRYHDYEYLTSILKILCSYKFSDDIIEHYSINPFNIMISYIPGIIMKKYILKITDEHEYGYDNHFKTVTYYRKMEKKDIYDEDPVKNEYIKLYKYLDDFDM